MQSAAARKLEDEDLALEAETSEEIEENTAASKDTEDEEKQEPQSKEPEIINVDLGDIGEDTYNSFNRRYEYLGKSKTRALLPTIIADLMRNCVVYLLAFAVTVLSIYKIIQVQNTRQLTATLNEVNLNIENQSRESLLLQAQRQSLSAHSFIREQAITKLGMVNPKTEAEIVIRLDN
jgi:cell division protein FtsL